MANDDIRPKPGKLGVPFVLFVFGLLVEVISKPPIFVGSCRVKRDSVCSMGVSSPEDRAAVDGRSRRGD